jgi:Domain of unknown function (DUF4270)
MNLWVKCVALGLIAATALLFFACLDEDNILGFENQNKKFKVGYQEFTVQSSVLLFDSLRTSNYFNDPIRRLLVGSYNDPIFGAVTSEAYTQIIPSNTAKIKETDASYDSVTVELNFDLSTYGSSSTTEESYAVHQLTEKLTYQGESDYYSNTAVAYNGVELGVGSIDISPASFDTLINRSDTIVSIKMSLDEFYGAQLFIAWDPNNTSFTDFEKFNNIFKGLAIVGTGNSKIVGFSPSTRSRVTLHYHTPTVDSLSYDFYLTNVVSSSHITIDRAASELAGLSQPYTEFTPLNPNKRYIQSGAPIVTKLDLALSKFLEFSDTIENLVINSAELSITSIDDPGSFDPPGALYLQILNDNNRLKQFTSFADNQTQFLQDSTDILLYSNRAFTLTNGFQGLSTNSVSKSGVFSPVADTGRDLARLFYDDEDKRYIGFITLFLQELSQQEAGSGKTRFTNLVLYPGNPYAAKSFNRVSFDKNNIKLKIYYTVPTINE